MSNNTIFAINDVEPMQIASALRRLN